MANDEQSPESRLPLMSIGQHDWSLHRKGPADQQRHQEKIKEAVRKNLGQIVSEESIILSDGQKTIKVPIRTLDEYRFRFDYSSGKHTGAGDGDSQVGDVIGQAGNPRGKGKQGQGPGEAGDAPGGDYYEAEISIDELAAMIFQDLGLPNLVEKRQQELETEAVQFVDIRKTGILPNLDKRRTIKENIKRNAAKGDPHFHDVLPDDLRFKTWDQRIEYQSNAVVIAMMDVSGCFTAGHLIEMADGSYRDIADVAVGDEVACVDLRTHQKTTSRVETTFCKYVPGTLLIKTQDSTLQATAEHRFFVYDEAANLIVEKDAADLAPGDKLILVNAWGRGGAESALRSATLSVDQAYLLGVLLGDGHLRIPTKAGSYGTYLSISDESLDRLHSYQQRFLSAFGVRGIIKLKKGPDTRQRLNVNSAALVRDLAARYPMLTKRSPQRYIEPSLYREPPEVRAAFLRGLFDAEGTLAAHTVMLVSTSNLLVKQIKHLLSYWGIRARITERMQAPTRMGNHVIKETRVYILAINAKDAIVFQDVIGFGCAVKAAKLATLVARQQAGIDAMRSKFIMPFDWRARFDHLPRATRTYSYYQPGVHALSASQLRTIAGDAKALATDVHEIDQVLNRQLLVSTIKSITAVDEPALAYDFGVAEHHNYIVDGILSHNSMGEFEKYIARSFYFWMVRFLRTKYQNVRIVFISHHTEAKEVTEEEFFHRGESGGTQVSSAYELALHIINERFPPSEWNIYPFHFSDGDNLPWDNDLCVQLVNKLMAVCNLFGYGEIREGYRGSTSTLMSAYNKIRDPKFVAVTISDKKEVYPALKKFFTERQAATP
jgi:uncharacterized sporulation protein YeaH/YhbH (DUF444 family)